MIMQCQQDGPAYNQPLKLSVTCSAWRHKIANFRLYLARFLDNLNQSILTFQCFLNFNCSSVFHSKVITNNPIIMCIVNYRSHYYIQKNQFFAKYVKYEQSKLLVEILHLSNTHGQGKCKKCNLNVKPGGRVVRESFQMHQHWP